MLVTVVDATLLITQAAHRVWGGSSEVRTAFADSLHELPLVFETNGLPDLLIVNVAGEITPYETTLRLLRCHEYRGRILALVKDLSDPDVRYLEDLHNAECILRPLSPDLLDETLRQAVLRPEVQWSGTQTVDQGPGTFYGIIGRVLRAR